MSDLTVVLWHAEDLVMHRRLACYSYPLSMFYTPETDLLYVGCGDTIVRAFSMDTSVVEATIEKVKSTSQR